MIVPYVNLVAQHALIKDELLAAVAAVIDHGQFVLGPDVEKFERRFAQMCGVEFAVGVNSGTDALILALKALGVGPGDEVITVPNSFVASASCIALVGAQPVFVDVGDDYNMDPALIEGAVTPRTKAILPVHLTGRPANMDPIMKVARRHNLYVIEDCAQAVNARYKEQPVGSFGNVGCFSLHPLKTLNALGDGGVLTTNDPAIYKEFTILRNHGLLNRDECQEWSYNSRLDTLQAAMLLVKMGYLDRWTQARRDNARFYQDALAGINQVRAPEDQPYELAVYHTFVVRAQSRDGLRDYLKDRGVATAVHYPIPIHLQPAAAECVRARYSFPVTERQATEIVSLPVYPELKPEQLEYVAQCVRGFYAEVGESSR